jgi:hypothetical protein
MRCAELFYLFINNKPDVFTSKIRAHLWLIQHVRHILIERRRVQSGARISEKELQSLMNRPDFGLILRQYRNLISKTLS